MTKSWLHTLRIVALALAIAAGWSVRDGARAEGAERHETAILAGGCFWCVESDFRRVDGVVDVVVGFTGGAVDNPSYRQVTAGGTGHREAALITFDPGRVSYAQIVHLFFRSVDPLDPGGQFCDRGHHYTTAIFVRDAAQHAVAEAARAEASAALGAQVVTPVHGAEAFFPAEPYHQAYAASDEIILTRFGPRTKASAYRLYRQSCGRDARVRELWGTEAAFARD